MIEGYDYSTREARETTINALYSKAKTARSEVESRWTEYEAYYAFRRKTQTEDDDAPFVPPVDGTPWIQVESQIDPSIPEPEFRGRDNDMDSGKARQREYAVRYICENNRLTDMNTRNERRLLKYGDAFWKAYWDASMRCGKDEGDIRIKDVSPWAVFPDPSIRDGNIQDGQFVGYVYAMHKVEFAQRYRDIVKKLGLELNDLLNSGENVEGLDASLAVKPEDDNVQVLEWWYKQPEELDGTPEGAVAFSVFVNGKEIKNVPDYWEHTHKQCSLFPFVHYWRIQDETQFWNRSELYPILPLVDALDRKLANAALGDAYNANDIILVEEGALSDGEVITNEPGAVLNVKQGRSGGVRRLGGTNNISRSAVDIQWYQSQVQKITRNYDYNLGGETNHQTTATGMAMMRSDADSQADIKKADRNRGFERLYELLDWLALEFFDDERLLFLGEDESRNREAMSFEFNSEQFAIAMPEVLDTNGEQVREPWTYYPKVDVTITASDSMIRGKNQTAQILQSIGGANITPQNYKIYAALLDIVDIPGKQDIVKEWEKSFGQPTMPTAGGAANVLAPAPEASLPSQLNGVPINL